MLSTRFHAKPCSKDSMLLNQVTHNHSIPTQVILRWNKPFVSSGVAPFLVHRKPPLFCQKYKSVPARKSSTRVKAAAKITTGKSTTVEAVVTIQKINKWMLSGLSLAEARGLDDNYDPQMLEKRFFCRPNKFSFELVAAELDSETETQKPRINVSALKHSEDNNEIRFSTKFDVPEEFGDIGAVLVNGEDNEIFLKSIVLNGLPGGTITVTCNSYVNKPHQRVFFANKSCLPDQTPSGLKKWRDSELTNLRGDGKSERQASDRVYDYDVYNDLGDPDKSDDLKRPVLGGEEHPYPRRCRTGRPRTRKDKSSEARSDSSFYVPRDESFSHVKGKTFRLDALVNHVLPAMKLKLKHEDPIFKNFTEIDLLFKDGIELPIDIKGEICELLSTILKYVAHTANPCLIFESPELIDRDKFAWFRDEEFCRQTVAGLNPCSIRLVTEWPLRSTLDPEVYGSPESKITKEMIEDEIKDKMTLEKALEEKRLFMLDYHDLFLPYVKKVRETKNSTLYGSRTLMFLTNDGTLQPLAIELTRPRTDKKSEWSEVFRPCLDGTGAWLWRFAKAHVLAHDTGYHQLVSHWLRTHCVTEPYIIASNRQLSEMHPIYRLLHPHFRYTMEINAFARGSLICADGIIESTFTPEKYSIELSSVAYDLHWRFDREGLPADLISRGMAVEDQAAPHGLRLTIEDYPFASDGLILWDAIKEWVETYVNHYYPTANLVESDTELQAWWTEIRTVGHGDKKDEPWWPELNTQNDLIGILSTIIWVTSGLHSAVNFGQYDYASYFPNRPTITRTKMPCEEPSDKDWKSFIDSPQDALLACFPSKIQAVKVMGILHVLSSHSPDEEYIGEGIEPSWEQNEHIKNAFEVFRVKVKLLEAVINTRNSNSKLMNRNGAGVMPYKLLKPLSKEGVTGMGVPNSISI